MRRFRSSLQRQGERRRASLSTAFAVLVLGFLITSMSVWKTKNHPQPIPANSKVHTQGSVADALSIECTGVQWKGKPVYELTNMMSSPMKRVTLYSWSEQLLPVIYLGQDLPNNLQQISPLSSPPFDLPPRQSLWFIASAVPPSRFKVFWTEQGQHHYADVDIVADNK